MRWQTSKLDQSIVELSVCFPKASWGQTSALEDLPVPATVVACDFCELFVLSSEHVRIRICKHLSYLVSIFSATLVILTFSISLPSHIPSPFPTLQLEAVLQRFPEANEILHPGAADEALHQELARPMMGSRGNLRELEEHNAVILIKVWVESSSRCGVNSHQGVGWILIKVRGAYMMQIHNNS